MGSCLHIIPVLNCLITPHLKIIDRIFGRRTAITAIITWESIYMDFILGIIKKTFLSEAICPSLDIWCLSRLLKWWHNSTKWPIIFKCWILLKPVLGGVNGSLHLPLLSMNGLGQTDPAAYFILLCWAFFKCSIFSVFYLYFIVHQRCLCRMAAVKSLPVHSILKDRTTQLNCCVSFFCYFGSVYLAVLSFSSWVAPVFLFEYCMITHSQDMLLFKLVFWCLICDIQAS